MKGGLAENIGWKDQKENPIICVKKVYFAYHQHWVLENVDLDIYEREFVSIIGPNGGGKTTLLKLILGILKPNRGEISVFGTSPKFQREKIGYVPQHAGLDLMFPATVLEVVLMGLVTKTQFFSYSSRQRELAERALERVGLIQKMKDSFHSLSGGQRQRVLIARALVSSPRILLFDEPTAHVDTVAEESIMELLKQLNEEITIILVSHDLGFVSQWVKTVVCVNKTVQKHPTNALTGKLIQELYANSMEMVQHKLTHPPERHDHE